MIEYVVAEECDAIIDDLKVGKKGADQNSNKAIRTDFRRPCIVAAALKKDITKAVISLKLKHLAASLTIKAIPTVLQSLRRVELVLVDAGAARWAGPGPGPGWSCIS
jgi:hypothetical protein